MAAGRLVVPSWFPARDRSGRLVPGALLGVYVNETAATKAAVFSDQALSTPLANPVEANSSGVFPDIWCEAGTVEAPTLYRVVISGPEGESIANPAAFDNWPPSLDGVTAQTALAEAAALAAQSFLDDALAIQAEGDDAAAIAGRAAKAANGSDFEDKEAVTGNLLFKAAGTGAVARSVAEALQDKPYVPADFDVTGDGETNDTTAMLAFYNACIDDQHPGHIPAGEYLLTEGVLVFDTGGGVDKAWPVITTDGHEAVTFIQAGTTDAPLIQWKNGTHTSGPGKYWTGGAHGGVRISRGSATASSGRHGFSLRGVNGIRFGQIKCGDIGGSAVHIPQALFGGTDPDPYAVWRCVFEGIEANFNGGAALLNENFVGFNLNRVESIRAIGCVGGGWIGLGAGNEFGVASMGALESWAFDDGTHTASTGGSPNKFTFGLAEIDDCELGIRINKTRGVTQTGEIRFVHRYHDGIGYYPRTAIELAAGTSPSVSGVRLSVQHRIDSGGVAADRGVFVNFNSAAGSITGTEIAQTIMSAPFTVLDSYLFSNWTTTLRAKLTRDGAVIVNRLPDSTVLVRADGSTAITNGSYSGAQKIVMPTAEHDLRGLWSTDAYVVPYTGYYDVLFRFALTAGAVGTRVNVGIARSIAGTPNISANKVCYAQTTGVESYELRQTIYCTAGDLVYPVANQNTGTASITLTVVLGNTSDNVFQVRAV